MSHRNKGLGKKPKTNAKPRTWRRWRIRHNTKEIMITSPNPPHYHIDNSVGGGA